MEEVENLCRSAQGYLGPCGTVKCVGDSHGGWAYCVDTLQYLRMVASDSVPAQLLVTACGEHHDTVGVGTTSLTVLTGLLLRVGQDAHRRGVPWVVVRRAHLRCALWCARLTPRLAVSVPAAVRSPLGESGTPLWDWDSPTGRDFAVCHTVPECNESPADIGGQRAGEACRFLLRRGTPLETRFVSVVSGMEGVDGDGDVVPCGATCTDTAVVDGVAVQLSPGSATVGVKLPVEHTLLLVTGDLMTVDGEQGPQLCEWLHTQGITCLAIIGGVGSILAQALAGSGVILWLADVRESDAARLHSSLGVFPLPAEDLLLAVAQGDAAPSFRDALLPCCVPAIIVVKQFNAIATTRRRYTTSRPAWHAILSAPAVGSLATLGCHTVSVLTCGRTRTLEAQVESSFRRYVSVIRHVNQTRTVLPGAGFAVRCWIAYLELVHGCLSVGGGGTDGRRSLPFIGVFADDPWYEDRLGPFDPDEADVMRGVIRALQQYLLIPLINLGHIPEDATTAVTQHSAVYDSHVRGIACGAPRRVMGGDALIPLPPHHNLLGDRNVTERILLDDVGHWGDVKSPVAAFRNAVELSGVLSQLSVVEFPDAL